MSLSGCYNKDCCRIRVNHNWNFELLNSLLLEYEDRAVIDLLIYGWPIEHSSDVPLELSGVNHKGATLFQDHIDRYIAKEVRLGATIGPFENILFKGPVAISPLSSHLKKDSDDRRIIMDCSWPIGASLNDGISKLHYLREECKLTYPTIDTVARHIFALSKQSEEPIFLWKEDLNRAFRQLFACPSSIPYLGYRWRGKYYFDLVMVMGCRIAPYVCQQMTDMLAYIHRKMTYYILNYVDDFLGIEFQSKIKQSHEAFCTLLDNLAVQRSKRKSVAPTQVIEFVGSLVDTINMMLGVTPQRKVEVLKELESWRTRAFCTRNQLESLVGKLQFMSNVVRPGRLFMSRLLNELRAMERGKVYHIAEEL